eukprot:5814225-Heterocapsa_arctica.AAC.1
MLEKGGMVRFASLDSIDSLCEARRTKRAKAFLRRLNRDGELSTQPPCSGCRAWVGLVWVR